MVAAICAGDGEGAAAASPGGGHDGFYGELKGGKRLRDGAPVFPSRRARLQVDATDVLSGGRVGYAAYDFSYVSKIQAARKSAGFSGISFARSKTA